MAPRGHPYSSDKLRNLISSFLSVLAKIALTAVIIGSPAKMGRLFTTYSTIKKMRTEIKPSPALASRSRRLVLHIDAPGLSLPISYL